MPPDPVAPPVTFPPDPVTPPVPMPPDPDAPPVTFPPDPVTPPVARPPVPEAPPVACPPVPGLVWVHEPFTQVAPGTQSDASVAGVHVFLQAPSLHAYGTQDVVLVGGTHALPSHVGAGVSKPAVAAQVGVPQGVPLSYVAHAPPRQIPVVPHVEGAVVAHLPCGSGELSVTRVQVPAVAVRLHAMHALVHALAQQTPWAQMPDLHSSFWLQSVPFTFCPHEAFWQKLPVVH